MWTRIRAMTAPTFSSHMLQGFFNTFVEQTAIFADELEKIGLSGNEVILNKYITNLAWRISCDTLMGTRLESNKNDRVVNLIHRGKKIFLYRAMNIHFFFFDIIFNHTDLGRKQKKLVNELKSAVNEMIQQRKDELNNLNTTKDEKKRTNKTFWDIWFSACQKENFKEKDVFYNTMTMLFAASDTVAVVMDFGIFMLANFPQIQEKVYEELLGIYGTETTESAPVKYDDLQYMQYMDRVLKETMRLFPPGPIIGRQVTEDLEFGEVVLPKGTEILVGIIKIHRDKKYWSNPFVFDPDRFLPERMKDCHSNYIPFSDGPRKCIGIKYGMMCMKVMLATLVRRFIFKVNKSIEIEEIKLKFDTLLGSRTPLKVKIEKR